MRASDVVIEFEQVSKRYDRRSATLRDSLSRLFHGRCRTEGGEAVATGSEFQAVKDVSFAVLRGETLGVIGANGAGKSTILKLIAGITAPTSGRIAVHGQVASLIELGAGFNQELTGRENIVLNGAVLGVSQREIERDFDRIAAFSGLGEFLDVPVKYYSSGMYAKLGFSVAVHVRADILLTDEILAVGDAVFQRQSIEKFRELKVSTTVVFVSHDLPLVERLCTRVLWFKRGRLECDGEPRKVIDAYLESVQREETRGLKDDVLPGSDAKGKRSGSGEMEILEVATCNGQGQLRKVFRTFDELVVRIRYRVNGPVRNPGFGVNICTQDNVFVQGTNTFNQGYRVKMAQEIGTIEVRYPNLPLMAGLYWLTVGATSNNDWTAPYDLCERVQTFEVMKTGPEGGVVCFDHSWSEDV